MSVRGARKAFSGPAGVVAVLDGIDLDVAAGEFVAVVGASGCGKSTLLLTMAGFSTLDQGAVHIGGRPVDGPSVRRVYVAQEPSVFPWFDVTENIAFGLRSLGTSEREKIVREYVKLVGLEGFERAYPSQLSGGMKQRLEFARGLAVDPDVLFFDEPFGALDAITRIQMRREIARIWLARQKTCVLVTHDVEEALELSDRVVVLSPRPARVLETVNVDLPRPRDTEAEPFRAMKRHIFGLLRIER